MRKFKWTVILSILTPILLIITAIFMGGGHGNYQQYSFIPYRIT